jgi:hypothetical protein
VSSPIPEPDPALAVDAPEPAGDALEREATQVEVPVEHQLPSEPELPQSPDLPAEPELQPDPAPDPEPTPEDPVEPTPEVQTQPDELAEVATQAEVPVEHQLPSEPEVTPETEVQPEPDITAETAHEPDDTPRPAVPRPSPPRPSPALLAASAPGASASARFGRVDGATGMVYVRTGDGEKEVGTHPGGSPAHALGYFARKYDELLAAVDLLLQRVTHTELSTKDATDALAKLRQQHADGHVVGDLAALDAKIAEIASAVEVRKRSEGEARAAARKVAKARREELVSEAERIAAQPEAAIQWKTSGARMRELLDQWKEQQRSGTRLDRESESSLWQRFSSARNSFDKARRVHFAHLESEQSAVKSAKEALVKEAETLATSTDWAPTATAFKRLMDRWRAAGRASRADDDTLWERFKTAQDSFFAAKDAISAKENEELTANLAVKTALLAEADALLPVKGTPKDIESAKARLRGIQDRWEKAGKVPRADLERTEKALRRVEQAVRETDDKRWNSRNPEGAARAESFVEQLRSAVEGLSADLARARESGNQRKVAEAEAALASRQQWLRQAERNLNEFSS